MFTLTFSATKNNSINSAKDILQSLNDYFKTDLKPIDFVGKNKTQKTIQIITGQDADKWYVILDNAAHIQGRQSMSIDLLITLVNEIANQLFKKN